MEFGVLGLEFKVCGLGFRVCGLGFRVWGLGFNFKCGWSSVVNVLCYVFSVESLVSHVLRLMSSIWCSGSINV